MATETNPSRLAVPVTERDHIQGPPAAKVTLVEYGDYQCPDCLQAFPIMIDIQEHLGARLRLVHRNFPLTDKHPHAQQAAEAAEAAAAQAKFWPMHDYLYQHQSGLDLASLKRYAPTIGLDLPRFTRDLEQHTHAARVRDDAEGGRRAGVKGTPTFFINGLRHGGEWDLETLLAAILHAAGEG